MNKTEKELEFLRIKKQGVERKFNHYISNYQHSAIYLVALGGGFVGILFSLGDTKSIPSIIMVGLALLGYKFVRMWFKANELNKLENKINNSINKRFEKLGVNVKTLEKEILEESLG